MRRVIVNSTPLIVLCSVGQLELLRKLYTEIHIPQAVYDEVTEKPDAACRFLKESLDWIHVEKIPPGTDKRMYKAKLHDGEIEVMILAQKEDRADLVIIDDNAAKKNAKFLGLPVTGTMGVLLKAKREGHLTKIAPIIEKMQKNGFYVSDSVTRLVLDQAGES